MGQFIQPDASLEAHPRPHEALNVPIYSGYQSIREVEPFLGRFRIFDEIIARARAVSTCLTKTSARSTTTSISCAPCAT